MSIMKADGLDGVHRVVASQLLLLFKKPVSIEHYHRWAPYAARLTDSSTIVLLQAEREAARLPFIIGFRHAAG